MKYSQEEMADASHAARLVFNSQLAAFGEPPLTVNAHFEELPLFSGRFPLFHLVRDGVCPMHFLFGAYFEVDIAGFPEVYVFPTVDDPDLDQLGRDVRRLLTSSFALTRGRGARLTLTGVDGVGVEWIKRTKRDKSAPITQTFIPYVAT